MIRAGVVDHPLEWAQSGFSEIQQTPKRYRLIDLPALVALCGFTELSDLQEAHRQWVADALHGALTCRDERWTQALAVGSQAFVEKIKDQLGGKALHRGPARWNICTERSGRGLQAQFWRRKCGSKAKNTLLWKTIA
jgi:putative transposase